MLRLNIMTPNGLFLDEEVKKITVKTNNGYLGILPRHLPLVASLEISVMKIFHKKENKLYTIDGGILFVDKDITKIITPGIEAVENIDLAAAKLELEVAESAEQVNFNQQMHKTKLIAINKVKAVEGKGYLKVD